MKILLILAKTLEKKILNTRSALFHMKSRVSLKYFVNDCLWKQIFASNLPTDSLNLNLLDNFGNSKAFHTVLEQLSCKKVLKFVSLGNCFSDPFTEV